MRSDAAHHAGPLKGGCTRRHLRTSLMYCLHDPADTVPALQPLDGVAPTSTARVLNFGAGGSRQCISEFLYLIFLVHII